jgi:hypothetical protein
MHPETHAHRPTHRRAVRLGLGALAATAALTALPSMASAATTCTYEQDTDVVDVRMDGGPAKPLFIQRVSPTDQRIVVGAFGEPGQLCNDTIAIVVPPASNQVPASWSTPAGSTCAGTHSIRTPRTRLSSTRPTASS